MEWSDEGIVLKATRHAENDLVAVTMTFSHGRHAGLVRAGASRKNWPLWQTGNRLELAWTARIAEQLGSFKAEMLEPLAVRAMQKADKLAAMASACAMIEATLPERQPFGELYAGLLHTIRKLEEPEWYGHYVRFELLLLQSLGFGLRLDECAVTGQSHDLTHVSPRTGRAVSQEAAMPYLDKLLPLPAFLQAGHAASPKEIAQGLRLAGFFFTRHVFEPTDRGMPVARDRLADMIVALDDDGDDENS